jgi:hypothetical protein
MTAVPRQDDHAAKSPPVWFGPSASLSFTKSYRVFVGSRTPSQNDFEYSISMKPLSSIFMVLLAAWLSRLHIKQVGKRRKLIDACLGVFASAMVPSLPIHASHGGDMQSMPARHQGSSSETGAPEARTGSPPRSQHAGSIDVQDLRRYLLPHIASRPALLPAGRLRCRLGAGLFGVVSSLCCEAPQPLFIAAAAPPRRLLAICRK